MTFGNASGAVEPFSPLELGRRGSLYVTRPILFDFIDSRERLLAASGDLFEVISSGAVKISINQKYSLRDATQAHIDLESRKTTGSTVLIP